jgi:hypothetical protein
VLRGVAGAEGLVRRLADDDSAARSEMSALTMLRDPLFECEIQPRLPVRRRARAPDFSLRVADRWVNVAVTRADESEPIRELLEVTDSLLDRMLTRTGTYRLEAALTREPTEADTAIVGAAADSLSSLPPPGVRALGLELGTMRSFGGDPAATAVGPSPQLAGPLVSRARVLRSGTAVRSGTLRLPFAVQRARSMLDAETRQLPPHEPNVIAIDLGGDLGATPHSWAPVIAGAFDPDARGRISSVLLWRERANADSEAVYLLNPHARRPLPMPLIDRLAGVARCFHPTEHPGMGSGVLRSLRP